MNTCSKVLLIASTLFISYGFTPRAEALPSWANSVSRYYCEFRAMGASHSVAMTQARRESDHWDDEIRQAGGLAGPSIKAAINKRCPSLASGSPQTRSTSNSPQPAASPCSNYIRVGTQKTCIN